MGNNNVWIVSFVLKWRAHWRIFNKLLCFWTSSVQLFYLEDRFWDWILSPSSGKNLLSWALIEIKNMRLDLILNEYPQEFIRLLHNEAIESDHLSSDTIYQGTVIIPYVNGISKKFRCIGNCFTTIFKSKHTLCGTLMKTGPVSDAQQTKQCVQHPMWL